MTSKQKAYGMVSAMWGSVLVVTLLSALNPVRLALTLLMASRTRPVQNLLTFWAGCVTGAILPVVIPLTLVHVTSVSDAVVGQGVPSNPTVRHVQIAMGAIALLVAATMTLHSLSRRRQLVQPRDARAPTGISRLLGGPQDAPVEGASAFQRILRRARNAWADGSLWIAYVIGMVGGGPQPDVALFVVAVIVGSGAAIATQVVAATAFVLGTFGIIEIILISYFIAPAKTLAVLQRLHEWVSAHRRHILATIFAVVGVALVTNGVGGVAA